MLVEYLAQVCKRQSGDLTGYHFQSQIIELILLRLFGMAYRPQVQLFHMYTTS